MGTVTIDLGSQAEVSALIDRTVENPGLPALALASVNLDHIHHFGAKGQAHDQAMFDTPQLQWATLLDGAPIAAFIRLRTKETWPLLPGSDLLPALLEQAQDRGYSVGFLGGMPTMHTQLAAILSQRFPQLQVAGFWAPSRAELTDPGSAQKVAEEVRSTAPDLLVVGLGKPRQEQWIQNHALQSGARVFLAFGAAADFLAGTSERAPVWMQKLGLEWLHRLVNDPARLGRRYLIEGPQAALQMVRFPPRPIETPQQQS